MKNIFRYVLAGIVSAAVFVGSAFASFAEEPELYYKQNGLVGYNGEGGADYCMISSACGYDQNIDVYFLAQGSVADLKTTYGFNGIADDDPDREDKMMYLYGDDLRFDLYCRNADYVEDWENEPGAGIYKITLNVMSGMYNFYGGEGIKGYGIRFTPISPAFTTYQEITSPADRFVTVPKGKNKRVYAIFCEFDIEDQDNDFYERNIDDFIEWSIDMEREILKTEEYYDEHQGNTESIEVSTELNADEIAQSVVSNNEVTVTIEENAEITEAVPVSEEKSVAKTFSTSLIVGIVGGIVIAVGLGIFIFRRKR